MDLPTVMTNLAAEFGMPALAPDPDGAYALRFASSTVTLRSDANGQAITMQSRLGPVAPQDAHTLQALVAANLVPSSIYNGALGIDAEAEVFLTHRFVESDADASTVLHALRAFVTTADHWRAVLASAHASPTAGS